MNSTYLMLLSIITLNCIVDSAFCAENPPANTMDDFVRVSRSDNRYFEFSDGTPYIPNGFNLVSAPGMDEVENIFEIMAQNRVNYCRLWIGQDPLDVEHEKSGQYDPERAERIARVIELAHRYGIRLKLCIEYFRDLVPERKTWSDRPWHHVANGGRYESMAEFLESEEGIEHFKQKLRWFADRFGNEPAIFGWELWNEMNAVRGGSSGIWIPWTEIMLAELQQLFPQNLVMQSLGSFDGDHARSPYRTLCQLADNDVAQVHRYLDLGAQLEVCHGPMDILAADAVRELQAFQPGKPILLAESGAVEPRHTGAFKLYAKDTEGMILHDVLFAPFFAGAAGSGHAWWWRVHIERNQIWWQFDRFAEAVKNINPAEEKFEPLMLEHPRLRIYVLKGEKTVLAWLRDINNTWKTELEKGKEPELLQGQTVDFQKIHQFDTDDLIEVYDPWKNEWSEAKRENSQVILPEFRRSIVLKIMKQK